MDCRGGAVAHVSSRWLIPALLAVACGGGDGPAPPEAIAKFTGTWSGAIKSTVTCGTQASTSDSSVSISLARGTDSDLEYITVDGCHLKFRVAGNGTTASLSNGPARCSTPIDRVNSATVTFSRYTLTATDQERLGIDVGGSLDSGDFACGFKDTGILCPAPIRCDAEGNPLPPPRIPVALEVVSGAGQIGVVGSTLPVAISVRAKAADGGPIAGVLVGFRLDAGSGAVSPPYVITGVDGIAVTSWTLGTVAGPQAVVAESSSLAPIRVTAVATPGPPVSLAIESNPADVLVGGNTQLSVAAFDAFGNATAIDGTPAWTSDVPASIVVSDDGVAAGKSYGSSVIHVSVGDLSASKQYVVHGMLSGSGTAEVDGVIAPGEWDDATSTGLTVFGAPGGGFGRLYVMNDDKDLYFALAIPGPVPSGQSIVLFTFDKDGDGGASAGDDVVAFDTATGVSDSVMTLAGCGGSGPCVISDLLAGGSIDAFAKFVDGSTAVFEVRHPLRSGDPNDVALDHGDRIVVGMLVRFVLSPTVNQDTTFSVLPLMIR